MVFITTNSEIHLSAYFYLINMMKNLDQIQLHLLLQLKKQVVILNGAQMEYIKCLIQLKSRAYGLYPNGQKAYSDGFVMGCTQIGNTQLICQSLVDSTISTMKTQPIQTTTQPTQEFNSRLGFLADY